MSKLESEIAKLDPFESQNCKDGVFELTLRSPEIATFMLAFNGNLSYLTEVRHRFIRHILEIEKLEHAYGCKSVEISRLIVDKYFEENICITSVSEDLDQMISISSCVPNLQKFIADMVNNKPSEETVKHFVDAWSIMELSLSQTIPKLSRMIMTDIYKDVLDGLEILVAPPSLNISGFDSVGFKLDDKIEELIAKLQTVADVQFTINDIRVLTCAYDFSLTYLWLAAVHSALADLAVAFDYNDYCLFAFTLYQITRYNYKKIYTNKGCEWCGEEV